MAEQDPPPPSPPAADQDDDKPHPFGIVPLVVIAVLVVGGWFLIQTLAESSRMQDCAQQGRKNCAPLDPALGR